MMNGEHEAPNKQRMSKNLADIHTNTVAKARLYYEFEEMYQNIMGVVIMQQRWQERYMLISNDF